MKYFFSFGFLFISILLIAQSDTTYIFPEVIVKEVFAAINLPRSTHISNHESVIAPANSVADLLVQQSHAYTRIYGPGRLITAVQKGATSAQTPIFYKGFQIQNSTLGLTDLSLIPTFLFDQLIVGGAVPGAVLGSGAMGTGIHLSQSTTEDGISSHSQYGSTNQFFQGIGFRASNHASCTDIKAYVSGGENNFRYRNLFGDEERLDHAGNKQYGFLIDETIKLNEKNQINFFGWHTKAERKIPPTRLQTQSRAQEEDQSTKIGGRYLYSTSRGLLSIGFMFANDVVHYQDPLINLNAQNKGISMQANARFSQQLSNSFQIYTQLQWYRQIGRSDQHIANAMRDELSLTFGTQIQFLKERAHLRIIGRYLEISSNQNQFVPSLEWNFNFSNELAFYAETQRTYRLPSLDDLFWSVGGNPDLRPEIGWHFESGLRMQKSKPLGGFAARFGMYSRRVDQWILWRPVESGIWSPENLTQVISRGIEAEISLDKQFEGAQAYAQFRYTFQRSTEEDSNQPERRGNQLIYTPLHQVKMNFGVSNNLWDARIHHRWVAATFGDLNNQIKVPEYLVGSFSLTKKWVFDRNPVNITMQINNLWNKDFEVISNYPLPGRQIMIILKAKI